MKINKYIYSMVVVALALLVYTPGTLASAFGVSPPRIVNSNIKACSNITYTIDLSSSDITEDMKVKLDLKGDEDLLNWINIKDEDKLLIKPNQHHLPMNVIISVPCDAKLGKYKGSISTVLDSRKSNESSINIQTGANISIDLNVVDYDVLDYSIKKMNVSDIFIGQNLGLSAVVKNLGNVDVNSIDTNIKISKDKSEDIIAELNTSNLALPVHPNQIKETSFFNLDNNLEVGEYYLHILSKNGDKNLYDNKLYFQVKPLPINGDLETSVDVVSAEEAAAFKKAEEAKKLALKETKEQANLKSAAPASNVATSVIVREPLTNKLIGVMIILLGVLIVIVAQIKRSIDTRK